MNAIIEHSVAFMLDEGKITEDQVEAYKRYLEQALIIEVGEAESDWDAYKDSWVD